MLNHLLRCKCNFTSLTYAIRWMRNPQPIFAASCNLSRWLFQNISMIAHNFAGVLVFILSLLCAFCRIKLTTRISVCAEVGARLT